MIEDPVRPATLTLAASLVLGCPAAALASDPVAPASPPRLAGLTKPTAFEVTSSSGSEDLDRATCAGMKGAKFVPARDQNTKAIESVYAGNFRWIRPAT